MQDETYDAYVEYIQNKRLPLNYLSTKSNFLANVQNFEVNSLSQLLRDNKIVLRVSDLVSDDLWEQVHSHSGRDSTYKKFKERFWFRGLSVWVRKKVQDCVACKNKNNGDWPAQRAPLVPIPVEPKLWWRVHVDLIGPLTKTNDENKYICIAVDAFSKYVEGQGNFHYFYFCFYFVF